MPKGYAIFIETVNDEEAMDTYVQKASPTVSAAGGAALVAGPPDHVIEGEWPGTRIVILEFSSVDAARNWYHSAEYQAVIGERHAAAEATAVIIGGVD